MGPCGAQHHSALGFFLWDLATKGPTVSPCLMERKAAEEVGRSPVSQGIHCIFGHRLPRFLALSTVFEGGLGALQEDPACFCHPKMPPRPHRWTGW